MLAESATLSAMAGKQPRELKPLQDPKGRYHVLKACIGSGTFGKVYMALDTEKEDALRVVKIQAASEESTIERLTGGFLQNRSHPNVMPLLDWWSDGELAAMVFDHMETNLWKMKTQRAGVWTEPEANHIFRSVAAGLEHCHRCQVVHGDLAASNILVSPCALPISKMLVKITDFGSSIDPQSFELQGRVTTIYWPQFVSNILIMIIIMMVLAL